MSYRIHPTECIVLSRAKSKEFDEIISVYSRDLGLISIIGYGLLRPTSKMRFHVDVGFILHLELIKGREFYILVGAKKGEMIMKPYKLLVWQSCVKILLQFSGEHDEDSAVIFEQWREAFHFLHNYADEKEINITVILFFTVNMLYRAGLWPHSQYVNVYESPIESASLIIKNHKQEIEDTIKRIINAIA